MDRLVIYRQIVQQVLTAHSQFKSSYGEIETFPIFDTERDHYQVVSIGWENRRRVYGCLIHIDIKNDKIWIQQDGTEIGVANELVDLGISKKDIVLGYHPSYARHYTEFAVG